MKQIKDILITITFLGVALTFGTLIIDSNAGKRQVSQFNFPSEIPLKGWQKVKTIPAKNLDNPDTDKPYEQTLAMQKYYYKQDKKQLEITMSYVVGTLGKAKTEIPLQQQYTRNLSPSQISPEWTKKNALQYAILDYKGKSHLIACINSRGGSTVTSNEFTAKRKQYDLQLSRFLPWLMGEESLLDRRCLWAKLSLPIQNNSPKELHQLLESTWFNWYDWWSDNFPKINS